MKQLVEISTGTILKIIAIILGFVFVYLIRDILIMLFISVIIAAAVNTPIEWLSRHRIRRALAVAIVYIAVLSIFALLIYLIVPPLAGQIKSLANDLPKYLEGIQSQIGGYIGDNIGVKNLQNLLGQIGDALGNIAGNVFSAAIGIFGGIFSAMMVLIISIYLAAQKNSLKNFFISIIPPAHHEYVSVLIDRIILKLGAWMRGQLILMAAVGTLVFIGLKILGIKFALTLALMAGLLEIIPVIGPFLAAVPAVLLALSQSLFLALFVAALYYVIQELEQYLLVPYVMRKSVGINSLAIIILILIGGSLYGLAGIVLAIPIAAVILLVFRDLMEKRCASKT
ncbi:MAG: AI-2E family transporter [Candidatus Portnoybacteria bacterium]|nr:AI-2E family transporter [Candidatus Portnoybacteria bacterium]